MVYCKPGEQAGESLEQRGRRYYENIGIDLLRSKRERVMVNPELQTFRTPDFDTESRIQSDYDLSAAGYIRPESPEFSDGVQGLDDEEEEEEEDSEN